MRSANSLAWTPFLSASLMQAQLSTQVRNTNVLKCGVFILWISIIIMATFCVITHNRLTSHKHIKRTAVHLLRSSWNPPSHDPPTISGLKSRVSPPSVSLLTDSTTNQTHPAPGGEIKADGKECGVHRKPLRRQWAVTENVQ